MSDQKSQEVTVRGFTQMANEFLEKLLEFNLTKNEYRLVIYFMRQLPGWKAAYRPFTMDQLISATNLPKQNLCVALKGLINKKVIVRSKVKGLRSSLYGFDQNTFDRVVVGEPIAVWQENSKVIDLGTFRVTKLMTARVPNSDTFDINDTNVKTPKSLTNSTRSSGPKYISNKDINIISQELRKFLDSQPRATKARWERFIFETIRANPGDQQLLWTAIELVHRTRKDFLGNTIQRSVIGLFENTDWTLVKDAMLSAHRREKEREKAEEVRREQDELLKKVKEQHVVEEVDTSKIAPIWRKYAELGKKA